MKLNFLIFAVIFAFFLMRIDAFRSFLVDYPFFH